MNIKEAKHILKINGYNINESIADEENGVFEGDEFNDENDLVFTDEDELGAYDWEDDPDAEELDRCPNCDGTGIVTDENGNELTCDVCHGDGCLEMENIDDIEPELVNDQENIDDEELEEAKRIVNKNGYKFVKEGKRLAGNHPVFSSKEFQEYLIKECGEECIDCKCDKDCKLDDSCDLHRCANCGLLSDDCECIDDEYICAKCR